MDDRKAMNNDIIMVLDKIANRQNECVKLVNRLKGMVNLAESLGLRMSEFGKVRLVPPLNFPRHRRDGKRLYDAVVELKNGKSVRVERLSEETKMLLRGLPVKFPLPKTTENKSEDVEDLRTDGISVVSSESTEAWMKKQEWYGFLDKMKSQSD
jgi:hypothetical protein